MLHACLVSTLLCFVYTLRYFYTFSRTNLLTRCCSASCLFSVVFGFKKASKEIFSKLDGTKAKVNISPERTQITKGDPRRATRPPHPRVARPPLGRTATWCGRLGFPMPRLFAYKSPRCQNPKDPIRSPRNTM